MKYKSYLALSLLMPSATSAESSKKTVSPFNAADDASLAHTAARSASGRTSHLTKPPAKRTLWGARRQRVSRGMTGTGSAGTGARTSGSSMSVSGEELGWGNCVVSDGAGLKRKYEEEFKSDDARMYRYWPQGYRWTCCGTDGGQRFGCDHHGTGPEPCCCGFCHMGKPLPDRVYNKDTLERRGLELPRGPDPRSLNPVKWMVADVARAFLGMPE
ncbi:hypothetical protein F4677DRAFT_431160 [Hypoxylon crocopeplum]|nr:hypothetical protein F4677DRAFT_431160 [Hypoxylon crocopeplum]